MVERYLARFLYELYNFQSQQVYTHDKDMLSHEQMTDLQKESQFDPEILGGSIKNKIVNPDLLAERAKCNFDK